jgi:hypothetical protein
MTRLEKNKAKKKYRHNLYISMYFALAFVALLVLCIIFKNNNLIRMFTGFASLLIGFISFAIFMHANKLSHTFYHYRRELNGDRQFNLMKIAIKAAQDNNLDKAISILHIMKHVSYYEQFLNGYLTALSKNSDNKDLQNRANKILKDIF